MSSRGLDAYGGRVYVLTLDHPAIRDRGSRVRFHDDTDEGRAPRARLRAIDALRGAAILWVILFHLWGDLKFFPPVPHDYYRRFVDQARGGGEPWHVFTAFTDILLRDGFQGVPLFMMLSGVALTMVAYRTGGVASWPRFFAHRFRKLMLPYWAGVALTYAVISAIAWREASIGGGGFVQQFQHGVTISLRTHLSIDAGVIFASATLVPRLLKDQWFFAPQLALWFVGLLAQYYLLFPLLLVLMKRIGLLPFLLLTFALTVGANWWVLYRYSYLELQFRLVTGWAPFRLFEFTAGMAIGAVLADPARMHVLARLRRPGVVVAALLLGFAAHTAGDLLTGEWSAGYWQALALPLTTLGLALLALPLITRRPSRSSGRASRVGWLPVRALAAAGVMSYTVLIVNDPMRLIASQLRVEHVPAALWWLFVVAVYVPVTMLLAWPLARILGLLPRSSPPDAPPRPAPADRGEEVFAGAPAG